MHFSLLCSFIWIVGAWARSTSSLITSTATISTDTATATATSLSDNNGGSLPTGSGVSYISYSTTITVSTTQSSFNASVLTGNLTSTGPDSSTTTADPTATVLVGTNSPSALNGTSSSTAIGPSTTNTTPCNGHPEYCSRQYSNLTYIAAHNSPFDIPNNIASNQEYDVFAQLNDGIRMLQGQTHVVNDTVYYCHTSCDLLNGGTAESYFANITTWLEANRYDVVTILIGNGDYVSVGNFTGPIESSGLSKYAYTPPIIPMSLSDWPTLEDLILRNQRAVIFMDYDANQTSVPYILDEFSQIWETPFDPTNQSFPCTVQRPPGLSDDQAKDRMYLANHNLNAPITLLGSSILVPDTAQLNETNALSGYGSLGLAANNSTWGRPPNFLLVDYYNAGNGSVFEVAAELNGVSYTKSCCGSSQTSAARRLQRDSFLGIALLVLGIYLL
ncbi:hypothetical protein MMC13_003942 [Lambiella insularis]|nr:hypothetical protein [Lambiella insularis]